MSPEFAAARDALVAARRDARAVASFPPTWAPADLDAAWALQHAVLDAFGPHAAWKVGAVTDAQRSAMRVDRPVGAAIPSALCVDAATPSATFALSRLIAPLVECEIAFRLGRDLPPRTEPWTRDEVEAAIASMHFTIELVDPRLPARSGTLAEIADGFNNGALVVGAAVDGWRGRSLADVAIRLERIGDANQPASIVASGTPRAVFDGDPIGTVVQLANAQPAGGPTLGAGDVVTTGSCTGAPKLPGPGRYRASYEGFGSVEVTFVA